MQVSLFIFIHNVEIDIRANTKHLYNMYTTLDQRRGLRAVVVQMLYKYFVF